MQPLALSCSSMLAAWLKDLFQSKKLQLELQPAGLSESSEASWST